MFNGIFYLAVLAVAMVLYSDLAESQCTTKYCEDHDEADLLAVCLRNQEIVMKELSELNSKEKHNDEIVDELKQQVERNQEVIVRLQREVNSTEERNQEGDRRLQNQVTDLMEKVARLEKKGSLGTSRPGAARSCKQILDDSPDAANGVYWICTSSNCTEAREVFCDMRSGGWTLIGQVGGVNESIYNQWLVTNHNTAKLRTPEIEARTYGCIDAVDLAVNYAHEIRLSSGESDTGMGQYWVEWYLPTDRDVATFWRRSVGHSVISSSKRHSVEVRSSFRSKETCWHNKYGIGIGAVWGGGYPSTVCGTMYARDLCMQVAVMTPWSSEDGFDNSYAIFDAPSSNSDWPNRRNIGAPRSDEIPPFLSVWLR